jgi:Fic family protein
MKRLPQVTVPILAKGLHMTQPTARKALNHLQSIGVLAEISHKKRDKVYVYRKYLALLEDGAEPFPAEKSS